MSERKSAAARGEANSLTRMFAGMKLAADVSLILFNNNEVLGMAYEVATDQASEENEGAVDVIFNEGIKNQVTSVGMNKYKYFKDHETAKKALDYYIFELGEHNNSPEKIFNSKKFSVNSTRARVETLGKNVPSTKTAYVGKSVGILLKLNDIKVAFDNFFKVWNATSD